MDKTDTIIIKELGGLILLRTRVGNWYIIKDIRTGEVLWEYTSKSKTLGALYYLNDTRK